MKKLIILAACLLPVLYVAYAFSGISISGGAGSGAGGATADITDVSVTQTELAELETINDTSISEAQWIGLGASRAFGISVMNALDEAGFHALKTDGADCAAGSYPLGVNAAGAVANCTDASTEIDSIVATHLTVVTDTDTIGHLNDTDWDTFNGKEDETHASEHNIGGADLIDRLFEGATEATIVTTGAGADTDGIVVSKGLYNTTGLTIVFDDFVDGVDGDHSDFNDGDYFGIYMNVATAGLKCNSNANMMCNAGTDFTGSAAAVRLVVFMYRKVVAPAGWYALNLNSGFSDPNTMSARIATKTPVTGTAAGFAAGFTGDNLYGGTYVATTAGTADLPVMAVGMNFCIITGGDIAVVVDTNGADGYFMDGTTNAEGKNLTNKSSAGDIACFQYYTEHDWLITTNGWTPEV